MRGALSAGAGDPFRPPFAGKFTSATKAAVLSSTTADCGERCVETHLIQMHHLVPFANGGEHSLRNVTLRCAAHNALAAEQDFGRDHMNGKSDRARHEARKRVDSG
jgi:hypothetical protein